MTMDRYEEALKRAKAELNAGITEGARNVLLTIFPQLKESDGERIRKEIIKIFNVENFEGYNVDNAEAIEWLKKQKPAEWSEEDDNRVKDIIYFLDTAKKHYASTVELNACIDWLKSLKERVHPQPKQEWSEDDEYNSAFIQEALLGLDGDDSYREKCCKMAEWLNSLKPQSTYEWSDADRENAKDICTLIDYAPWSEDFNKEKLKRWLRTIVPQKTERK